MSQQLTPPDFIMIPRQLLIDERLQPLDRVIFGYIYWLTKLKNEKCTAGNKVLAELAHTSSTSVQNSLVRLEKTAYITKIYADDNKKNRLEIQCNVSFFVNVPSASGTVPSNSGTSQQIEVPLASGQKKNKKEKIKKSVFSATAPIDKSVPEHIRDAFTDFVSMYTEKYGKFTDVSKKQTIGKLDTWYKDKPMLQIECLNKATRMQWKGIWKFDDKEVKDIEASAANQSTPSQGWKPEDDNEWKEAMRNFRDGNVDDASN